MRLYPLIKLLRQALAVLLILQFTFALPAGAQSLPYRLVDTDQYDIFREDQQAKEEQKLALEDPPDDANLLKYSNEFWRQAVTSVEGAYKLDKEPEPIPDLTLLNPTLSLPLYGTSIALTGRYVLGFKMASKKYKKDDNNSVDERSNSSFEMDQQLQLKMQGKILERVFVDIDYDPEIEEGICNGHTDVLDFVRELRGICKEQRISLICGYRAIKNLTMFYDDDAAAIIDDFILKGAEKDTVREIARRLNGDNKYCEAFRKLAEL